MGAKESRLLATLQNKPSIRKLKQEDFKAYLVLCKEVNSEKELSDHCKNILRKASLEKEYKVI